jgi:molybdenum cofactor cytidylyltransferase
LKFGPVPVADAEGAILAHSVRAGERRLRKAQVLTAADVSELVQAGVETVVAAVLSPGDLGENEAATVIAAGLASREVEARPAATGRVNLHARAAGVFVVDRALIDAINSVDPAITIATLPEHARTEAGQMVATVKIIPFAVAGELVEQVKRLSAGRSVFSVEPFRALRVGIVQTTQPDLKESVLAKTAKVTAQRLARSGSSIVAERRARHDSGEVAAALSSLANDADLVIAFGASAVSDPDDVIPAAIRLAGGVVLRTGMPVDPGNLLVLGRIGGKPVLGAPGCARSPKENGFDWVLDRLLAGLDVSSSDIAGMGVGGLLMEIPTRPQPREKSPAAKAVMVESVVLAAGRSSRMAGPNKLLALFDGTPLIRRTVEAVLRSRASSVVVVTGHQEERAHSALAGLPVRFAANPDFASGLASSLRGGISAVSLQADGALVALGDMPGVTSGDLDRLVDAFEGAGGTAIVRATHEGKRGNPVILPRSVFPLIATLEGDVGARQIVESGDYPVVDVDIGAAAATDVDTPEAMRLAGGVLQG